MSNGMLTVTYVFAWLASAFHLGASRSWDGGRGGVVGPTGALKCLETVKMAGD